MRIIRFAAFCIVLATVLFAQTNTGRVRGLVVDSSGAVIPSANVSILHEATGLTREMLTNASGQFGFDGIPLGKYTVVVTMQGFRRVTTTGNDLQVGEVLTVDIRMEPGAVTESVTVSERGVQIQTAEASLGNVLDTKPIESMPLNGRNPLHLMALQPGVSGHASQATTATGTVTFSVNGDRGRGIFTTLDGVDISDPVIPRGELSHVQINPDAISEYRVITSVAKAEYGRNSGAQVQVVTRSGTNTFHGNLFEFNRNTLYNANEWFNNRAGNSREILIRNQYGASIGGPIIKNKAFFFFNWQSQRMAQTLSQTRTVLTPQMRAGIFRYYVGAANAASRVDVSGNPLAPACSATVTTACYRSVNLVAADPMGKGLDKLMQSQVALTNLPNDFSGGDGYNTAIFRFNAPANAPKDSYLTKVDWRFGSNHSTFLRWNEGYDALIGDYINTGLQRYPANPAGIPGRTRTSDTRGFSGGITSVFGSSRVNEFNLGYTRNDIGFLDPTHPKFEIVSNIQTDPFIFWGGTGRKPLNWQALDNFSFIKGNHTFKTGINVRWYSVDQFRRATNFYPRLTFGTADAPVVYAAGTSTTGINSTDLTRMNSLFNDLMGVVSNVRKVFYSNGKEFPSADQELAFKQRNREYNFYFQDDWRVSPRLTLNLGVRYEFNSVPEDLSGMQVVNDKPLGTRTGDVSLLPAGPGTNRPWYNNDKNNFAPAVGFAWTPFGGSRTAVRGGYRVAYNRLVGWALNVVEQNQPGTTLVKVIRPNSNISATNPTSVRASDAAVQTLVSQLPTGVVGTSVQRMPAQDRSSTPLLFDPGLQTPFVHQWNLSIQHQIMRDTVLEVAYVGNKGTHMFRMLNANQAVISPEFLNSFRAASDSWKTTGTQAGVVRTGPVGALLNTYGAALPSTVTSNLANNDMGGFISTVTTNAFTAGGVTNQVGGRMIASGLGLGYFNNPQFTIAALGCACTDSSYNALQISLNRRFAQGFMFQTNYTWAKSIDDISDDTDGAGQGLLIPYDSNNRKLDRGRSGFDIRHQFRAGFLYELPFGKGKRWLQNGLVERIVGGWSLNGLVDWSSGYPYSVAYGLGSTIFPNVTGNSVFAGDPTSVGKLVKGGSAVTFLSDADKAKFSAPAVGGYGAGRNIFTGPGFFQTDLALHKSISITERFKFELRGEAFNVFNNVNFSQPTATSTSASFGVITSTRVPPRILQVAAKFSF